MRLFHGPPAEPAAHVRPGMSAAPAAARSRRLGLSCNRSLVLDVLHFARQVPVFPVERSFDLAEVAALRAACPQRISWALLFLKAYALVARDHPPLRQAWQPWPWPHLLEHPHSVATLAVHREFRGEERLCWGRFERPETRSLDDLAYVLRRYQELPVEQVFREQVQLSRLPRLLRQSILGWNLHLAGGKRAKRLGTFSISTLAGQATLNRGHPTMLTTSLTYGPLDASGRACVTLLCDHRVLDGHRAAAVLNDLERVLQGPIAAELAGRGQGGTQSVAA
jgi:hypothetical protein